MDMKDNAKTTVIVSPNTHWDREWRYPLWRTRQMLVEFMDGLLRVFDEQPGYSYYFMDGQSVPIEDYLEVRPEMRETVCGHIREGRLAVGPWYTAPDLYPVDGECLVRNLLKGTRLAQSYGRCLKIAYTSFGWGQTAQFPQIYAGFGFRYVMASKKVSEARAPQSEFLWEAPDGTRLLTTRLGEAYRSNVFFNTYLPIRFGIDYETEAYRFDNMQERLLHYKNAEGDHCEQDGFVIADEGTLHPEWVKPAIEKTLGYAEGTTVDAVRLFVCGSDYSGPQGLISEIIALANEAFPDFDFRHGSLDAYFEALEQRIDRDALKVVHGELRDGRGVTTSANALATRMKLKTLNRRAQTELMRRAEPLYAALTLLGAEYPKGFFDAGWEFMLKAHAHDSINGVTQDKTADNVRHDLHQALEIGEVLTERAQTELVRRIDLSGFEANDILLVLFNPNPRAVRDVIGIGLDTAAKDSVWDFTLTGPKGDLVDIQVLSRREEVTTYHEQDARPIPHDVTRHRCALDTGALPALGYRVLKLNPVRTYDRNAAWWPPLSNAPFDAICPADGTLENAFLRVELGANGTLTLTDKERGRTWKGLHTIEETGEVGDYWVRFPPSRNRTFTSRALQAKTWVEENGRLRATIGVELQMDVPVRATPDELTVCCDTGRSEETRVMTVVSRFTLKRGSRRLEVHTVVDNTVEDHRVRVGFPTGIRADVSAASGHFTVDERPVRPREEEPGQFYPEMQTMPQQHFVDLSDGTHGLAVLNRNLMEFEACDDEARTLYLTLFRGVRNRICTEFRSPSDYRDQKGGQQLGRLEFDYALYPHAGDWKTGRVYEEADAFAVPIGAIQTGAHHQGTLPLEGSFLELESDALVLSAFKRAEDRETLILRCFNPTGEDMVGRIRVMPEVKQAWRTNLDEVREEELAPRDGVIELAVGPRKIVTLELST
jgi:mannosylglycerate hydrolase